jgi:hypothetical protein
MRLINQQVDSILNHHASNSAVVLLTIDENESLFELRSDVQAVVSIPVGYKNISDRYFKHTPPTPAEIEYAINEIEDEIEKIVPKLAGYQHVYNRDDFIIRLAHLSKVDDALVMAFSRDRLESVFGQYAEISMGRPPSSTESDVSPLFYAQILLIREFMHHLKFDQLNVIHEKYAEEA